MVQRKTESFPLAVCYGASLKFKIDEMTRRHVAIQKHRHWVGGIDVYVKTDNGYATIFIPVYTTCSASLKGAE